MIHIIGNTALGINAKLDEELLPGVDNNTSTTPFIDMTGHGAIQAVSAARCGARVSLISTVGTDIFGKYILDILRKEGVQTSSLAKRTSQNELTITFSSPNGATTNIGNLDTREKLDTSTLPAEHFNARNLIVISEGIDLDKKTINWLEHIRLNGAKIILCLRNLTKNIYASHSEAIHSPTCPPLEQALLAPTAPCVPGADHKYYREDNCNKQDLIPYADIIIRDESSALPSNIAQTTYLITTKEYAAKGATAQKGENIAHDLNQQQQPNHGNTISFDIFCGYFAACIQASQPIQRTLEIACKAAALAAKSSGAYSAIPYLGHLEDIKETSDLAKTKAVNQNLTAP